MGISFYSLFPVLPHALGVYSGYSKMKCCFPITSETPAISDDCGMTLMVMIYMNYINKHLKSSHVAIYFSMYSLLSTHYASFICSIIALNLPLYYSNGNCKLQTWKAVLKILHPLLFSKSDFQNLPFPNS